MPIYQEEQRLAKLKHLRNEVDLEIRTIEKSLRLRAKRARRITRRMPSTREAAPVAGGVQPRVVREWARSQGLDVGLRGRVRDEIVQAYVEHHPTNGASR